MQLRCKYCGVKGNVPESAIDKSVRCPKCGNQFKVTMDLIDQGNERRRSERVPVAKVDIDFGLLMGASQLFDLSTTGAGFTPTDTDYDFVVGQEVQFDLLEDNTPVVKSVPARVTRSGQDVSGLEFRGLSAIQKHELGHFISRKKFEAAQKEAESIRDAADLKMDDFDLPKK